MLLKASRNLKADMVFACLWAAEKPETELFRVGTALEETSPSELWVKT